MALQFVVRSSTPTSSEALNVFVFEDGAQDPVQQLLDFYEAAAPVITSVATFTIDPAIREFDPVTGQTTGFQSIPGPDVWEVAGTAPGAARFADATAALIQWRTSVVAGGRLIRGRTFIPFLTTNAATGGNPGAGTISTLTSASEIMRGGGFAVWSRTNGVLTPVTTSTVWSEFAVQRGRRD